VRFPEHSEASVFNGTQEVVSLVGTINDKGAHLHISFADKNGRMNGGHVMPGCVVNGLEVVLVGFQH
jgi:predicted DNA-binding protein with PD1-like motif